LVRSQKGIGIALRADGKGEYYGTRTRTAPQLSSTEVHITSHHDGGGLLSSQAVRRKLFHAFSADFYPGPYPHTGCSSPLTTYSTVPKYLPSYLPPTCHLPTVPTQAPTYLPTYLLTTYYLPPTYPPTYLSIHLHASHTNLYFPYSLPVYIDIVPHLILQHHSRTPLLAALRNDYHSSVLSRAQTFQYIGRRTGNNSLEPPVMFKRPNRQIIIPLLL
jgi:hypothetical protein